MMKNFYHGEHGGHGDMKREAGVEFFLNKQPLNSDPFQKLFFPSVFAVSSVVKPLSALA